MGKKGQVTIFIIIAMAVLIVLGMVFFSITSQKIKNILTSTNNNIKEIEPIKSYIEKSIQDLVVEGLLVIGKQGGKIYLTTWPDCKEEDPNYYETHRMCNQKGDLVYEYPPYVSSSPYKYKRAAVGINDSREQSWTQADRTTSYFPLEQPFAYLHQGYVYAKNYIYGWDEPLPTIKREDVDAYSIEGELSNWTKNHLFEVLNFSYFEKVGYEIKAEGEPTAKVSINENDITVNVNYSFIVKKGENIYKLNEFYTSIPYNFRRFYRFIKDTIQTDITTLQNIVDQKMYDENGEQASIVQFIESNPNNFKYDLINISDVSLDFHLMYNTKENFFSFYFIRENRAPDAGTVEYAPTSHVYEQTTISWKCENYETTKLKFVDPDEDDQHHLDPFPFISPQWYHWYSRGDYVHLSEPAPVCPGGPLACPLIDQPIRYHNDPENRDWGVSWADELPSCGNHLPVIGAFESYDKDVGDLVILKVGDQMDYGPEGSTIAPDWYVDSPVIERGTGRLNDVQTFRPVHCIPGMKDDEDETCQGGYWRFMQRSLNNYIYPEEYCIETCTEKHYSPATGSVAAGNFQRATCPKTCHCSRTVRLYGRVDHTGDLKPFPDIAEYDVSTYNCDINSNYDPDPSVDCLREYKELACTFGASPPTPASPSKDGSFKPVCCASEDGVCHDIDIPVDDNGCGKEYPKWTSISGDEFCNQEKSCRKGCCTIRGKNLDKEKQRFECLATCVEAGVCTCTGDDLSGCSGDYSWSEGSC